MYSSTSWQFHISTDLKHKPKKRLTTSSLALTDRAGKHRFRVKAKIRADGQAVRPFCQFWQILTEGILSICFRLDFFKCAEVQEVIGSMSLMVEGVGVCQLDPICHPLIKSDTLEIEVPAAHIRHHVEAHESARPRKMII